MEFETGDEPASEIPEQLRPSRGVGISTWLVQRATSFLEARSSRRGFLVGTAVTGSAFAVAGVRFATRTRYCLCPGHRRQLPAGIPLPRRIHRVLLFHQQRCQRVPTRLVRGWVVARRLLEFLQWDSVLHRLHAGLLWADVQSGRPHVVRGCVACQCGPSCNNRKVYCNYFRYGQCHQEIPVSGPIACRVVTCVPPYVSDLSCTPASAVDNETAEHNTACNASPRRN